MYRRPSQRAVLVTKNAAHRTFERTPVLLAVTFAVAAGACSRDEHAPNDSSGGHSATAGGGTGGAQSGGRASAQTGGSETFSGAATTAGGSRDLATSADASAGADASGADADAGGAGGTVDDAAGGSGGAAGITGSAVLTVPFVSPDQQVSLGIQFGEASQNAGQPVSVDFSKVAEVRFRYCVASASDPENTFLQVSVTDRDFKSLAGTKTPISDAAVATCPSMKDLVLPITGETLDRTRIASLSLEVATSATASSFGSPTVIYLDAVTATNNVIGPYDFARNIVPLKLLDGVGSTLRPSAPDLSSTKSPGGALVEFPSVRKDDLKLSAFSIYLGPAVSFKAPGTVVTYRLCQVSAPDASELFVQHFLTDIHNENLITPAAPLPPIASCPTLSEMTFVVADYQSEAASFDAAKVNLFGFGIGSMNETQEPNVFFIDSIEATRDIVGPYDFTLNENPLRLGYSAVDTRLDWAPAPYTAK